MNHFNVTKAKRSKVFQSVVNCNPDIVLPIIPNDNTILFNNFYLIMTRYEHNIT